MCYINVGHNSFYFIDVYNNVYLNVSFLTNKTHVWQNTSIVYCLTILIRFFLHSTVSSIILILKGRTLSPQKYVLDCNDFLIGYEVLIKFSLMWRDLNKSYMRYCYWLCTGTKRPCTLPSNMLIMCRLCVGHSLSIDRE